MAVKAGSFLQRIKQQIAQSGTSKKGFWYVKENQKRRIRFLDKSDLEEGVLIPWHSKWEGNRAVVSSPCLSLYGKECPFCGQDDIRLQERYAWSIYDYEQKEVQVFLFAANRNSPVPHMAASYEEWGTIIDRDLTIARNGSGTDTTYTIIAGTPSKFRFSAKLIKEKKVLDMVWKAYGQGDLDDYSDEGAEDEEEELEDSDEYEEEYDEEEEELPRKPVAKVAKKAPVSRRR